MINELFALSEILNNMGIKTEAWHKDYKTLPEPPCYKIWVSKDGPIKNIEKLDDVSYLRKFGHNQASFPAFNICPLYKIAEPQKYKQFKEILKNKSSFSYDDLKLWCEKDNWKNTYGKIIKCLNKSQELSEKISSSLKDDCIEKKLLFDFINSVSNMAFRESLEVFIWDKLRKSEQVDLLLPILFHFDEKKDKNKKDETDSGKVSVILDFYEWKDYAYPVSNNHIVKWINSALLKVEKITLSESKPSCKQDAFGFSEPIFSEKMPKVKIDGLNEVTLRAMFNEQHCQERYGCSEDRSYPLSKKVRSDVKVALEYIKKESNEGTTWAKLDKKEIVFVYPSKMLDLNARCAAMFSKIGNETKFETLAKDITKSLQGLPPDKKPDNINIFSIKKMDKARSKVVFTRNCSSDWFIYSAQEWQQGCENIPEIQFLQKEILFPGQVPDIINTVYKQDGESVTQGKKKVKRMQYWQGLELLLDDGLSEQICCYLRILLSNSIGLVKSFGNNKTEKKGKEVASLFAVLGLFLYKCNYKKEGYVENIAYLTGQMLKISDELHFLYCKVVRSGDIPPQLAGNSVFITASEMPLQALVQLCKRMNPYISWAKQYRYKNIIKKDEESWKAGWLLKLYEYTCDKLKKLLTENLKFTDFDKAQFFIGYLASFPKSETNENTI